MSGFLRKMKCDISGCFHCRFFFLTMEEDEIVLSVACNTALEAELVVGEAYRTSALGAWKHPDRVCAPYFLQKKVDSYDVMGKFKYFPCFHCHLNFLKTDFRFVRNQFATASGKETKENSQLLSSLYGHRLSAAVKSSQRRCAREMVVLASEPYNSTFNLDNFNTEADFFSLDACIVDDHFENCSLLAANFVKNKIMLSKIIGSTDLLCLASDDTRSRVEYLVQRALGSSTNGDVLCAAVCVYPRRVKDVCSYLQTLGKSSHIAIVAAGLLSGQYHIQSNILEVELTVADGATEIDIQINRAAAIEGDWKTVFDDAKQLHQACGSAKMKTSLAAGELESLHDVYKSSIVCILAGSTFIEVETSNDDPKCSFASVYVDCCAIKRWHDRTGGKVGVKLAGDIKTSEEAMCLVALIQTVLGEEWIGPELFRIGASSNLFDNMASQL